VGEVLEMMSFTVLFETSWPSAVQTGVKKYFISYTRSASACVCRLRRD